ncbi:hypothetical protein V1507DRAFT_408217 [Lipomyces tetrasporus]
MGTVLRYSFVTENRNKLNTRLLLGILQNRPELQGEYVRGGVIVRARWKHTQRKQPGSWRSCSC